MSDRRRNFKSGAKGKASRLTRTKAAKKSKPVYLTDTPEGKALRMATYTTEARTLLENLDLAFESACTQDLEKQKDSMRYLRILLSQNPKPAFEVVHVGGGEFLRRVVMLCQKEEEPEICNNAIWVLVNIASVDGEHTFCRALVDSGLVPVFVRLAQNSNSQKIIAHSLWGLANISGESVELRDFVLKHGAHTMVYNIIKDTNVPISSIKTAAWILSNLCRGSPPPPAEYQARFPELFHYLTENFEDRVLVADVAWGMAHFTSTPDHLRMGAISEMVPYIAKMSIESNCLDPKARHGHYTALRNLCAFSSDVIHFLWNETPISSEFVNMLSTSDSPGMPIVGAHLMALMAQSISESDPHMVCTQFLTAMPKICSVLVSGIPRVQWMCVSLVINILSMGAPYVLSIVESFIRNNGMRNITSVLNVSSPNETLETALEIITFVIQYSEVNDVMMVGEEENQASIDFQHDGVAALEELVAMPSQISAEVYDSASSCLSRYFGAGDPQPTSATHQGTMTMDVEDDDMDF